MDKTQPHPLFKLATELGPLMVFFVANAKFHLFVATGAFMIAVVAAMIVSYVVTRHVPLMALVSGTIVIVFGTLTLVLHDETFIKWKPTVLYWLFAVVLAGGRLLFRRNLIGALLPTLTLPEPVWARITWAWVGFLVAMGATNLYVASNFTTDTWVNFKVWGGIGLFMLAAVGTVASVARYLPEES